MEHASAIAFNFGEQARIEGRACCCPFANLDLVDAWERGWHQADNALRIFGRENAEALTPPLAAG